MVVLALQCKREREVKKIIIECGYYQYNHVYYASGFQSSWLEGWGTIEFQEMHLCHSGLSSKVQNL